MIIYRYLGKEVFSTLLATAMVMLLIFLSNQFVRFLGQVSVGSWSMHAVALLMALQVPLLLGLILPLSLFLGILMSYGRLYVESEMTVMSACGVSRAQIMGVTLIFAVVVMLLVSVLMFWLGPPVARYGDWVIAQATAAAPIENVQAEHFQGIGHDKQWVYYIGGLTRNRKGMRNVFLAHVPNAKSQWDILSAASAHQAVDPKTGDRFLVAEDGYRFLGTPGQKDFQVIKFHEFGQRIDEGKVASRPDVKALPTATVWRDRSSPPVMAELQWRISMPISVLVLAFLALPLSRVQPRRGRYAQLLPAILIYVIYANMLFVTRSWVDSGSIANVLGMWWLHAVVLMIALLLWIQQIGWRRVFMPRRQVA